MIYLEMPAEFLASFNMCVFNASAQALSSQHSNLKCALTAKILRSNGLYLQDPRGQKENVL